MLPSKMVNILGEPGTGRNLNLVVSELANGEPYSGWLENPEGDIVGVLSSFRFSFVNFSPPSEERRASADCGAKVVAADYQAVELSPFSLRFSADSNWYALNNYLLCTSGTIPGAKVSITTNALAIDLHLHKHPWSGHAAIHVDGKPFALIDLFNAATSVTEDVRLNFDGNAHLVEISAVSERNKKSMGYEVILEGIAEFVGEPAVPMYKKKALHNRGAAFHRRFYEIINTLSSDAVVLDIGGGKRQIDDKRYVNLEYAHYSEPDIFGDATCLPFKNGTIDFVYSAAVMEHVTNPLLMGSEISRVLKSNGIALINSAFMQPVHSEGQHFFNATPYGIELAMKGLAKQQVWWEGNLSNTLSWLLDVSGLSASAEPTDREKFLELSRKFDGLLTQEGLMYIASGVWFEGRKA